MIDLPDHPAPASAAPALVDFGAFLTPSLGGPVQRVERMGTRFKIAVQMPPMPNPKLGRQWVARLIRGKQEGARMAWPLQGFDPGTPGNVGQTGGIAGVVLVNGTGQSGRTLVINAATPNYVFREGQFFSVVISGRHYLYMVTAETIASATGTATLPIEPMLRVSPPNNSVCHFGKPMVEGFILGDSFAWEMALANFVGMGFELSEIE
jgi:hypothetical protein